MIQTGQINLNIKNSTLTSNYNARHPNGNFDALKLGLVNNESQINIDNSTLSTRANFQNTIGEGTSGLILELAAGAMTIHNSELNYKNNYAEDDGPVISSNSNPLSIIDSSVYIIRTNIVTVSTPISGSDITSKRTLCYFNSQLVSCTVVP